ncbi:TMV resistance protein N-like isoform X2 [Rhodamnia argentea]|uniref:TMV resistance protein N-like isoform X2 n=1 Tax=Rhodamnia argentea TaxID=178133 RepID=A0A8B8R0D6_9MYRT|nr:TMV resistance protein N-like isoform X2 [Rhodamnia argentea]
MASSSKPVKVYHVFLSFRGTDVRDNFLRHLYAALDLKGIYTYVDSEELRKGEEIGPALTKAIEKSHMAVIIFSEDYASSSWCLEEAAKIMECREERGLMVFTVFYKVEPREVRTPRDKYRKAMDKHESKYGENSEEVKRWKKALSKASNLSGWELKDGDDSDHIQRIVKDVATSLGRTPLHVAKHPVGIDSRVVKLKSMLNLESQDGVLMMGLWGKGGIGKTTLAKAIYNDIFGKFDSSSFLADVRETSKECKDLVTLQEKLLSEILLRKEKLVVSSVDAGSELIRERLQHKKVLLVLDDVDDLRQLNALAGEGNWFGNGSRIIVTTRDKHLITCHAIDQVHVCEVKALEDCEARELLSNHAFSTHQKLEIRRDLVDGVLNHAGGLPLALEVLGSFLCGRREDVWESSLKKLSRIPNKTINDVLKISYDGLEENEKEIFLDIACFFKRRDTEYVKKVLNSCELEAVIGLEILIERSLINIEHEQLQMHDLIQSMGKDIVRLECRDDPGRRSRLWLLDDVVDVTSSDMGDCAVKAIVLEPPTPTEIYIDPDAFTKMRKLRLLILRNVHNSFQGPIYLPNELRWFRWAGCARPIPEFSPGRKKLVGLDMKECNMTVVPKQFKDFQQLKYLNFSECQSLFQMPDLSCTPNLEELDLQDCKNLVEAHDSIAYHDKLLVLNLSGCSELCVFPNVLKSKNLGVLDLDGCTKLEKFPDIPHKLEGLKELGLQGTAIKELPTSIENLVSLEGMHLSNCKNLVSLPSSIYKLQNIETLALGGCTNLIEFPKHEDSVDPHMKFGLSNLSWLDLSECNLSEVEFLENLSCFSSLTNLFLSENDITCLPTSINKRHQLRQLEVSNCRRLQGIPELPPFLSILRAEGCKSLQKNGEFTLNHNFFRRTSTMPLGQEERCQSGSSLLKMISCLSWLQRTCMISSLDLFSALFSVMMNSKANTHLRLYYMPMTKVGLTMKRLLMRWIRIIFGFIIACQIGFGEESILVKMVRVMYDFCLPCRVQT